MVMPLPVPGIAPIGTGLGLPPLANPLPPAPAPAPHDRWDPARGVWVSGINPDVTFDPNEGVWRNQREGTYQDPNTLEWVAPLAPEFQQPAIESMVQTFNESQPVLGPPNPATGAIGGMAGPPIQAEPVQGPPNPATGEIGGMTPEPPQRSLLDIVLNPLGQHRVENPSPATLQNPTAGFGIVTGQGLAQAFSLPSQAIHTAIAPLGLPAPVERVAENIPYFLPLTGESSLAARLGTAALQSALYEAGSQAGEAAGVPNLPLVGNPVGLAAALGGPSLLAAGARRLPGALEATQGALRPPEPTVTRVAAYPGALEATEPGLAGAQGAMRVRNPAGVRILQPGEAPRPGEQVFYHGSAGPLRTRPPNLSEMTVEQLQAEAQRAGVPLQGRSLQLLQSGEANRIARGLQTGVPALEAGAYLTPSAADALTYANVATRIAGRTPAGQLRQLITSERGSVTLPGGEPSAAQMRASLRQAGVDVRGMTLKQQRAAYEALQARGGSLETPSVQPRPGGVPSGPAPGRPPVPEPGAPAPIESYPEEVRGLVKQLRQGRSAPTPGEQPIPTTPAGMNPAELGQQLREGIAPGPETPRSVLAAYRAEPISRERGDLVRALQDIGEPNLKGTKAQLANRLEQRLTQPPGESPITKPSALEEGPLVREPAGGAAAPPPRRPQTPTGGGSLDDNLRTINGGDDFNAIIRNFKRSLEGESKRIAETVGPTRQVTARIAGDITDPYLAEIVNQERQLEPQLAQNLIRKIPRVNTRGLTPAERNFFQGQEAVQVQEALNKAREGTRAFRADALAKRYSGTALNRAENILLQNDIKAAQLREGPLGQLARVQNGLKELRFGIDFGVALQQDLKAARTGATSFASGVLGRTVNGIGRVLGKDGDWLGVYPDATVSHEVQRASDGLIRGGAGAVGIERARPALPTRTPSVAGRVAGLPGKAIQGLTNVQYGALQKVRDLIYEGRLYQAKLTGGDIASPQVRRDIANYANMATSTARTATEAGRQMAERGLLLSPQMTRAQFAEIAQPLRTLTSTTNALNTVNQLASTAATFGLAYALSQQFGMPQTAQQFLSTTANPLSPQFGRMTLKATDKNGRHINWNFLPQFSLENAVLRSIRDTKELARGDATARETLNNLGDIAARFGVGRLNVGISSTLALGGYGYGQNGQFFEGNMPMDQRLISAAPIPLSASQAFVEGQNDPVSLALNILGGNTYSESAPTARDRAREQHSQDMFQKPYDELTQAQKNQVDAQPDVAAFQQQNLQERAARGDILAKNQLQDQAERQTAQTQAAQIDQQLAANQISGADARKQYDQIEETLALQSRGRYNQPEAQKRIAEIPQKDLSEPAKARQDYFDNVIGKSTDALGNLDFDKYDAALSAWEQRWPQFSKEDVSPARPLSPKQAELKADRVKLQPYFDVQKQAWEQIRQQSPAFQPYDSLDAFRESRVELVMQKNPALAGNRTLAEQLVDQSIGQLSPYLLAQETQYLMQHRDLIPLLGKWGYSIPHALVPLAGVPR